MNEQICRDQNALIGALTGVARASDGPRPSPACDAAMAEALCALLHGASDRYPALTEALHTEKFTLVPNCKTCASPCGRTFDWPARELWDAPSDERCLKLVLLFLACQCAEAGKDDLSPALSDFFYNALFALGEVWELSYYMEVIASGTRFLRVLQTPTLVDRDGNPYNAARLCEELRSTFSPDVAKEYTKLFE